MQVIRSTQKTMNHTVAARLALAFLQMAEDEWVLFCRMELARPMGYEKVMVRECMKLIKHRIRNKCREYADDKMYFKMLDDMASLADVADPHVQELRAGIRKSIVGIVPQKWSALIESAAVTYTMLDVVQKVIRIQNGGSDNATLSETMNTIDGLYARHHIDFGGNIHIKDEQLYKVIKKVMENILKEPSAA